MNQALLHLQRAGGVTELCYNTRDQSFFHSATALPQHLKSSQRSLITGEPSTGQAASAQGSTDGLHTSHDLGAVLQHPMRFVLPDGPAAPVPYPVGGGGPCGVRCSAPSRRSCTASRRRRGQVALAPLPPEVGARSFVTRSPEFCPAWQPDVTAAANIPAPGPQHQGGWSPAPHRSVLKTSIVRKDPTEKYPGFW